ncbi:hypothetical protein TRVA0_034S00188 [Trichomonascus vanleenenianus]|uniref:uncharacterized protein n=1 Tax=Trichomonascus vanleenenianus TaxID=2268995 RepID=UPI003EC97905
MTNEQWPLLSLAALSDSIQVERLVFDISEQAGWYALSAIPYLADPFGKLKDVRLNIRNGDFSYGGLALQIVKSLHALDGKWKETTKVEAEVSRITTEGRNALEKVSSVIAAISIHRLRHRIVLNHLTQFLQNSGREVKINIKFIDLQGETRIYFPRGNLSLSIEEISRQSKVFLECQEKLACLSITKYLTERLVGPELDIDELRVTRGPNAADVRRITAQFANVRAINTDIKPGLNQGFAVDT